MSQVNALTHDQGFRPAELCRLLELKLVHLPLCENRYGKSLIATYRDIKDADNAVHDKLLIVEAMWVKTSSQLQFVKNVARVLEEEHCRIHLEVLETLNIRFAVAISKLDSVIKRESDSSFTVRPLKYARFKASIDDSISQLQQWQEMFDPTWYLILLMKNTPIDDELAKRYITMDSQSLSSEVTSGTSLSTDTTLVSAQSLRNTLKGESASEVHVSLPEDGLDWSSSRNIEYSSTCLINRSGSEKVFAVDTISCASGYNMSRLRTDSEGLAKKLKRDDIDRSGLLPCKGIIKKRSPETRKLCSISLAFQLPRYDVDSPPVSLRHCLLQKRTFSLS